MTRRLVYVLVILLCTASVGIGVTAAHPHETAESPTAQPTTTQSTAQASSTDEIGCVDGICHDDDLEFEQPTNLSEAELDALVARTMARVEYLRDEPFSDEVPVEIQSRETFRESDVAEPPRDDEAFEQWNDQVWKGLFVVGDDERSADAIDATVGEAVNGFYMPNESRIVLVTESTDSPNVNELTLLHEFAHALQDQRHNLTGSQFSGETQDADLAVQGVVEGEAVYLEYQYEQRCASGEWSCFDEPNAPGDPSGDLNQGILFALLQPYSDGPAYVHDIVETEGWSGVDDRIQEPPETTREIIHRQSLKTGSAGSTGTDSVDTVESPPEPTEGWERYPDQGVSGAETVGEASLFVMLWYQASEYGADTVEPGHIHETTHEYERFNYVSDPSDGWAGDELIPYQRDDDDGYVWTIEWETSDDVDEFTRAYSAILDAHDATETEYGAYVISDGSFSGAYAVETDDTQVRIVHAPTEVGLFELDPSLDPTTVEQSPLEDDMPGFGVAAAVAALLALAVASRRR